MKIMFLDESGDHSLSVIDPQYPLFVLGGIIVDQSYAEGELDQQVRRFKQELFGSDNVILHTADITRSRGIFSKITRPYFYAKLNDLMQILKYKVVACVVKKDKHLARYGMGALDPYMLSLSILAERFCFEIGKKPSGGLIVAEKRNPTLDHELDLAWLNLKIQGTRYIKAKVLEERISGLVTRSKAANIAGLQIADLVVSPIGRYILGKKIFDDFKIIESKFRRGSTGSYLGSGLVILPKE